MVGVMVVGVAVAGAFPDGNEPGASVLGVVPCASVTSIRFLEKASIDDMVIAMSA